MTSKTPLLERWNYSCGQGRRVIGNQLHWLSAEEATRLIEAVAYDTTTDVINFRGINIKSIPFEAVFEMLGHAPSSLVHKLVLSHCGIQYNDKESWLRPTLLGVTPGEKLPPQITALDISDNHVDSKEVAWIVQAGRFTEMLVGPKNNGRDGIAAHASSRLDIRGQNNLVSNLERLTGSICNNTNLVSFDAGQSIDAFPRLRDQLVINKQKAANSLDSLKNEYELSAGEPGWKAINNRLPAIVALARDEGMPDYDIADMISRAQERAAKYGVTMVAPSSLAPYMPTGPNQVVTADNDPLPVGTAKTVETQRGSSLLE